MQGLHQEYFTTLDSRKNGNTLTFALVPGRFLRNTFSPEVAILFTERLGTCIIIHFYYICMAQTMYSIKTNTFGLSG